MNVRLHRDDPKRRDPFEEAPRDAEHDSAEAVLAHGHAWLRFPARLEAEFKADTLEPRRRLLTACALIGCLGTVLGSLNVMKALPDVGAQVWHWVWIWLATALVAMVSGWFAPAHLRRSWHPEMLTAAMSTAIGMLIIWATSASRAETAISHSAMVTIPVMYNCIAARLRFYWALGATVIPFAAYVLCVKGLTPEQAQLVTSLTRLMALNFGFGLLANYSFEHRERRTWLLRKVEARQRETLLRTSAQLRQLSIQDPLTGLFNRRKFDAALSAAMSQRAGERRTSLALLVIDVDHFKRYNDTHGHPAGDACLIEIARMLATFAKAHGGLAARLGGEEFALLLPDLPPELARHAGDAVCRTIAATPIRHGNEETTYRVTVSVGLAHWDGAAAQRPLADTPDALFDAADDALYQAKSQGRNRLCVASEEGEAQARAIPLRAAPPDQRDFANSEQNPDEDPASLTGKEEEAACARTLEDGFKWLRFPPSLEMAYTNEHAEQRRRFLAVVTLIGLLIYNLFATLNRSMFPDVADLMINVQWWLSASVLALTAGSYIAPTHRWREGLYSLNTATVALATTWMLSHSHLTATLSYAACLMVIPMYAGVGARQPFWFTCIPAAITTLAAALMLKPEGPIQHIVYQDTVFMIISSMAYTLILSYTMEHGTRKEWLLARIDRIQRHALEVASQRLKALSVVDPLTSISNRRQFEDDLDRIWEECQEDQRPLAMLIVDIDHFKLYNDKQGHLAGDECLRRVATIIAQTAQADKGLAARLGGEEFGVLLPGGGLKAALRLAEDIRAAVSGAGLPHDHSPSRHVTVSIGVASIVPQAGLDRVSLFATADKALYEAKRDGRNRVKSPNLTSATSRPRQTAPAR